MQYFYILVCIFFASAVKLPDGVNLCHRSQPDFAKCVEKNINSGLQVFAPGNKAFGIPSLEPYFVEKMEILPDPGKTYTLQQKYKNIYIYGMTKSKVNRLVIDVDKECSWETEIFSPLIRMEGEYELNGKILVFPINAHGNCNVSQINLLNTHRMWCEKYVKNGNTYIKVTNYTMDMKLEGIKFDFVDLFPTNKQIEAEILKTLDDNGLSIFKEIKEPFEHIFSMIQTSVVNKVFTQIPLDEIFLP